MSENKLHQETSPYLKQHENNPVWWQPWGEEALNLAQKENKPIFLSVGYSTCHWCHVMEAESFEDQEVAAHLNDGFISVKVDREERPDVDSIYMQAVQQFTGGRGGWPMSVWLTPEGHPFYGATYFPKPQFIELLKKIKSLWFSKKADLLQDGLALKNWIEKSLNHGLEDKALLNSVLDASRIFHQFEKSLESRFDPQFGGFGNAPKFPSAMTLMALLRAGIVRPENESRSKWVKKTLEGMSYGGLFDHVEGGFFRYSVDEKWLIPHFEKMLYDNALLSKIYLESYQCFGLEEFKEVATSVCDYVQQRLERREGGFYAAEDADSPTLENPSVKKEGYYYTYSYDEIKEALTPQEFEWMRVRYGFSPGGQFESRNHLHLEKGHIISDRKHDLIQSSLKKLKGLREKRRRPDRDEKILVEWNAYMIDSFCLAYKVLGENSYLKSAERAARFILENHYDSSLEDQANPLKRSWCLGSAKVPAYAEDYAALTRACLSLFRVTGGVEWIRWAKRLQNIQDRLFWDSKGGGYFQEDGHDQTLFTRTKNSYDGVHPTASSLSALNLFELHSLEGDSSKYKKIDHTLKSFSSRLEKSPDALAHMLQAVAFQSCGVAEAVIVAKTHEEKLEFERILWRKFWPTLGFIFQSADKREDELKELEEELPLLKGRLLGQKEKLFYLCEGQTCQKPLSSFEDFLKQVEGFGFG
jgi:hypothetical protein